MKRLLLISLIGLTYASQAETNKLLTLAAQSALPPLAGLAAGTVYTLGRAAIVHTMYTAPDPILRNLDRYSNKFINTLAHGSESGSADVSADMHNIGHNWQWGICGGTALGILYSLYKCGVNKDGLKLAAGIAASGYGLHLLAQNICEPYYAAEARTVFYGN